MSDDRACVLQGGRVSRQGPHTVISVFQGGELHFNSVDSMLDTCVAWVSHPEWTPSGHLLYGLELELWKRYNPGVFS